MKKQNQKLILLFAFALAIRLIGLNQSLWLDEAISANIVRNYSFAHIITQFSPSDFHPPLFYLLLKLWSLIFGTSVVGLRLFSLTVSLLSALYLYKTSLLLFNKKVALNATAFLLLNPLFIYYSQELRMYALITLFLSASTYYFFKKSIFLFNLFTFLSFLTFYGSIFYIISLFLLLIFQKKYRLVPKLIPGIFLSLLIISPLLFKQIFLSKTLLRHVANWSLVLGKANLKNILLIPLKFSFGRLTFYPKKLYYLVSAFWTLFLFIPIIKTHKSKKLIFLFFAPLSMVFLLSFKIPMLQYFRYIYLLPILSLLLSISFGKSNIPILFGFTLLSFTYLFFPNQHREDWKSLAGSLPPEADIYLISSFADPLKFYRPDLKIVDIRQFGQTDQVHKPPIFIIPYGFQIFDFNHFPILESFDFTLTKTQNFRQINLETWTFNSF